METENLLLLLLAKEIRVRNEENIIRDIDINIKISELRRLDRYKNISEESLRKIASQMR